MTSAAIDEMSQNKCTRICGAQSRLTVQLNVHTRTYTLTHRQFGHPLSSSWLADRGSIPHEPTRLLVTRVWRAVTQLANSILNCAIKWRIITGKCSQWRSHLASMSNDSSTPSVHTLRYLHGIQHDALVILVWFLVVWSATVAIALRCRWARARSRVALLLGRARLVPTSTSGPRFAAGSKIQSCQVFWQCKCGKVYTSFNILHKRNNHKWSKDVHFILQT